MKKTIKYIDLFAGAGGLSLGFFQAGLHGIFAIEKNADAFSTLKHNLIDKHNHFSWVNWLEKESHSIEDVISKHKNKLTALKGVDLVCGGPPCQGFSLAGLREFSDIRNDMVNQYIEFIKLVKPKYLFLENVHGITVHFKQDVSKIAYSEKIEAELKKMGYYTKSKIISMDDFGIPQKRKRFILVGSLKNNINDFFERLEKNKETFLTNKGLKSKATIFEAISDLERIHGEYKEDKSNFKSGLYGDVASNYQRLMRGYKIEKPDSHRFANHTEAIIKLQKEMINKAEKGKRITPKDGLFKDLRRRGVTVLNENDVSPTVTSHPDDFIHYSEPRILTVRELARIQSFPDSYEFKGKYTTGGKLRKTDVPRYTQVGNAIPPLFGEQIGLVFKEIIDNEWSTNEV